jgi:hypothetical protein
MMSDRRVKGRHMAAISDFFMASVWHAPLLQGM